MQKPSPAQIANIVRLKRQANGRVSVLVEAGGDVRFYRRFLQIGACDLTFAHGKENAVQVASMLENEGFQLLFAIVDSNFDRLNGLSRPSDNVIWTDCHDLEALLIQSPAFDKVLGEIASDDKLREFETQFGDIRKVLLHAAVPVGYLRLHSSLANLDLRFDGLRFNRFINAQTLSIDVMQLLTELKNRTPGRQDLDPAALRKAVSELQLRGHDPWDVCNGHDLVAILVLGLRGVLGSKRAKGLGTEDLESYLRLAYDDADFRRTQVYMQLQEWERRKDVRILL